MQNHNRLLKRNKEKEEREMARRRQAVAAVVARIQDLVDVAATVAAALQRLAPVPWDSLVAQPLELIQRYMNGLQVTPRNRKAKQM